MKAHVQHNMTFAVNYLRQLLEEVDPDDLARTPKTLDGVALNPPAWVVGHVITTLRNLTWLLTGQGAPTEAWSKQYSAGSKPTDNPADYPTKQQLLDAFNEAAAAATQAVANATDDQLAQPNPRPRFNQIAPKVGDAVVFVTLFHLGLHTGELLAWRRCTGIGPRF